MTLLSNAVNVNCDGRLVVNGVSQNPELMNDNAGSVDQTRSAGYIVDVPASSTYIFKLQARANGTQQTTVKNANANLMPTIRGYAVKRV